MVSEEKKNPPIKYLKAILVSIGIALIGTAIFFHFFVDTYHDPVLSEDYELGSYECEGWYDEIRLLFRMNEPITDIDSWSQPHQNKYIELENRIMFHCTIQKSDVMQNLDLCVQTYNNIQDLISQMEERLIDSLPEEQQENYYGNRTQYFRNNCDLLQAEINATLNRN